MIIVFIILLCFIISNVFYSWGDVLKEEIEKEIDRRKRIKSLDGRKFPSYEERMGVRYGQNKDKLNEEL